ncbi:putative quinol monooxygenase [Pseudonocardia sp. HH130630-07]|uniref:putative quinol monooxygenase n=1 Tax=Pseudonocardia sp. HH130630-07 TaxID=1690815 RepID=UPI0008153E6D|nr:antibiotic biosynthesis monooxygenase family protein [Pseudonocardia sp. HH130630-07]ANY06320.1 antibiotic biosynthesis monooxygenase [Pseudonocardia sp. HH130630-07]
MLFIAGHLIVEAADRDTYVAACASVVELARGSSGCLDFAITADTLDPRRVNVVERWASEAELLAFRGSGPDAETAARILDADVARYTISEVGPP